MKSNTKINSFFTPVPAAPAAQALTKESLVEDCVVTDQEMPSVQKQRIHLQSFPPLVGESKTGKTKIWKADIFQEPSTKYAYVVIQHGQKDGKLQADEREYKEGKNIGRANETTPLEQCIAETNRKWTDKKEKEGYLEEKDSLSAVSVTTACVASPMATFFPMLAQTYEPDTKQKKKQVIAFPCYVQPKLDGLRCVMYPLDKTYGTNIVAQSRTGSKFETVNHISQVNPAIKMFFHTHPTCVLDGELYTTEIPFEELAGLIKKKKISDADLKRLEKVEYHIYDMFDHAQPGLSFEERYDILLKQINWPASSSASNNANNNIRLVDTVLINEKDQFRQQFAKYVQSGYEGIMLRNRTGKYLENHRSSDLQKYKEFFEEEYPIVGFGEGDGRDKGTVIWQCVTPEGERFSVRPKGTIEFRREQFSNAAANVGKRLTVIYQELSTKGVPRFPVGKSIRDGF